MTADGWPLIGRDGERALLAELVTTDAPRSVVVTGGGPGVGRTRLVREAVGLAAEAGRITHRAAGTAAAARIPLGALAHLVPASDARDSADAFTLLRRAMSALTAGPQPVLLAVDDAHLLDDLSLTLLHQLATAGQVALVVTTRGGGSSSPDPLAALWKDGLATRVELQALARADADRLVAAGLGGDVDTRTLERLWRLARGNPLFLRELVEGGRETGRLSAAGGLWRWDGEIVPPPRLVDIVRAQLAVPDPGERAALEVLAIGEPIDLTRLVALTDPDAVEALERRGLLVVDPDGRARTAHPMHAEVVRRAMPGATAGRIRSSLANGTARPPSHEDLLRTSSLTLETVGPELDGDLVTEAAWRANGVLDHGLAERLARVAVERGAGIGAHLALLEALRWQDRPAEVEELTVRAAPLAMADPDRARLAVLRAVNLARRLGREAEADAVLSDAVETLADERAREAATAARAVLAVLAGDPRRALELAEPIHRAAERGTRPEPGDGAPDPCRGCARALAAAAVAASLAVTGRASEAVDVAAQGWGGVAGVPTEGDVTFVRLAVAHAELLALRLAGRFREMERRAAALHEQSMAAPDWAGDAIAAYHLGCAASAVGKLRAAVRWLTEAMAGLRRRDPAGLLPLCAAELATARALLRDPADAADLLAATAPAASTAPVQLAHAWHAAAVTEPSAGAARLIAAAERAATRGEWAVEAELLHGAVQLGRPAAAARRLRELAGHTGNRLVLAWADHAEAVLADSGARLDRVSARFEEMGAHLVAADAAATAAGAHQRAGDRRRAALSSTAAARLAQACDAPATPALDRLTPPRLTVREEEVARLVASGLTNAAIARRLVLSVRTVEAHLAHAYAKLGINSRSELSELMPPAPGRERAS
ncbi:helix-turn-helix transcriptional regulator [Pseudonocardia nigra]|uniref:helix-turn-helix transcriptional regulator n=1 Tax=Pseudonocardia nigra TaxID=1921578 RepID=UPI001C5F0698|nr:helix-turn-helix transcriptional regulator [Pseudonocardia nigra]